MNSVSEQQLLAAAAGSSLVFGVTEQGQKCSDTLTQTCFFSDMAAGQNK